uniref:Uncharacterized protein n=1 Tax=Rhizophagus irregularis (strain DAOM 181602 / DAOM 197198 / MUCL 43194) TaxID=747089 RepID=U9UB63_RHIID
MKIYQNYTDESENTSNKPENIEKCESCVITKSDTGKIEKLYCFVETEIDTTTKVVHSQQFNC